MSWGGYQNGLIPFSALTEVEPGKWLQPAAAEKYLAMKAACKAATGSTFYMSNSSNPRYNQQAYRQKNDPYAGSQQYFWDHRKEFGISAAWPGTSNHGWAVAVDITFPNSAVRNWYRANCHTYDWNNAGDNFGEDWHKEYVGSLIPAGGGTKISEGINMAQIQFYQRSTNGDEWMIGGRELPGGYVVTLDINQARLWGRQYSSIDPQGTVPVKLDRDTYIAQQVWLKADHEAWKAEQLALIREALGVAPAPGATKADVDAAADRVIQSVPTAVQNGQAAREAIVK